MNWIWIVLALVILAAIFGFGGIVSAAAEIFVVLFWILLIIFVIGLIAGLMGGRRAIA
ncbi:MAG: DUF1328 domain-containing protein [Armatimonadota bacterium]